MQTIPTGPSGILPRLPETASILTGYSKALPSGGLGLESYLVIYKTGLEHFDK